MKGNIKNRDRLYRDGMIRSHLLFHSQILYNIRCVHNKKKNLEAVKIKPFLSGHCGKAVCEIMDKYTVKIKKIHFERKCEDSLGTFLLLTSHHDGPGSSPEGATTFPGPLRMTLTRHLP